ncbi:MAG: hypothetical protein JSV03_08665 [Planctomycetota bacterium]|nr:MAG: hypothetical protein JSV03_08665 [Planctomycetota bacterium]
MIAICALFILACASEVRASRCSGISEPVFCDDFDRYCDPPPTDPNGACNCTTDSPDQNGFLDFWPADGVCTAPLWPDPGYESVDHTLVGDGSNKCNPPELTEGYGVEVHQMSGENLSRSKYVMIKSHVHDMTQQILDHADNINDYSFINGRGPIDMPYAYPVVHPNYVDSMDRGLRPEALKGQFNIPTGSCGNYGVLVFYVELFLDDDRAPLNFIRHDCERPHDCACKYNGDNVSCGGTCDTVTTYTCSNTGEPCTTNDDCSFCDPDTNTCRNTGKPCATNADCIACVGGPLDGMSCTEDLQCSNGPFWQAVYPGDGQRHNSLAIGFMAVLDSNPCDRDQGWRPSLWRLVVFDGLQWSELKAPAFDIPMTPEHLIDPDRWDARTAWGLNKVQFAIGADYMEVRLYNDKSEAIHTGGKCVKPCDEWKCFEGINHGLPCTTDADCPADPPEQIPPMPNPYFVARVPRKDGPEGGPYGPFNKIALGPGQGLDGTTPTCINYGTELEPYRRCLGGENDGGECETDADCPSAVTERCIEVNTSEEALIFDELVLYDGVFQGGGACCLKNTTCVVTSRDDCLNNLNGVYQGDGVSCSDYLCCHDPFADADNDGDVDQDDFAVFQVCYGGSGVSPTPECKCFDQEPAGGDGDVDGNDFSGPFETCASGPDVPANPACDG